MNLRDGIPFESPRMGRMALMRQEQGNGTAKNRRVRPINLPWDILGPMTNVDEKLDALIELTGFQAAQLEQLVYALWTGFGLGAPPSPGNGDPTGDPRDEPEPGGGPVITPAVSYLREQYMGLTPTLASYQVLEYELDTARDREQINVTGDFIAAWTDGTLEGITIQFNSRDASSVELQEFNPVWMPTGFSAIHLTHAAQANRKLRLYVSSGVLGRVTRAPCRSLKTRARAPEPPPMPECWPWTGTAATSTTRPFSWRTHTAPTTSTTPWPSMPSTTGGPTWRPRGPSHPGIQPGSPSTTSMPV